MDKGLLQDINKYYGDLAPHVKCRQGAELLRRSMIYIKELHSKINELPNSKTVSDDNILVDVTRYNELIDFCNKNT